MTTTTQRDSTRFLNVWYSEELSLAMLKGWCINSAGRAEQLEEFIYKTSIHLRIHKKINIYINLELFDFLGGKYLIKMIGRLNELATSGNISLTWAVPSFDSEICHSGLEFKALAEFPFHIVSK